MSYKQILTTGARVKPDNGRLSRGLQTILGKTWNAEYYMLRQRLDFQNGKQKSNIALESAHFKGMRDLASGKKITLKFSAEATS